MSPYKIITLSCKFLYGLTKDDWYNRLYLLMNLTSSAGRIRGRLLLTQKLVDLKISLSLWRSPFRFVLNACVKSVLHAHLSFVSTAIHLKYKYLKKCRYSMFMEPSTDSFLQNLLSGRLGILLKVFKQFLPLYLL